MNNTLFRFFKRNLFPVLVIFITLLVLTIFYGQILFHPQKYILSDVGDGIKNYYCYEWHVHNDTSMANYSGSNYPYGENHGYTDGNPLLSNILRVLPVINNGSIAIFNLSVLLSFVFCSLLLFKILKEFKVSELYAVIGSIGITFLSPQVFRLTGHFSLSYNFCIPLVIYLLLKMETSQKKSRYILLISACTLSFLFIHPYLGMITTSLLLVYWLIRCFAEGKMFRLNFVSLILQAVVPLAIYFLYTKYTDTHFDRVAKPYGFFFSTSSIETIFISTHKPFRHFLSNLYPIKGQNYEGVAYVGITSVFFLFYLLFLAVKKRKKIREYLREYPKARNYLWMGLSSVVLLLFSMGYPFKLNMNWILDYVPILQQFRIPGRFAWAFYFITTIGITVFISNYFLVKANKTLRLVLCSILLLLFFVEGVPFQNSVSKNLPKTNCFDEKYVNNELKAIIKVIRERKPNAVIPLPFFHIGTDYYNIPGTEKIIKASLVTCFHSKTPLMASLTPRNSLTEAESLIQLVSNDLIEREIKTKVPLTGSFIIIYSKETLSDEEAALLGRGKVLLESQNYLIKEVNHEELFASSSSQKQRDFSNKRGLLILKNGFLLSEDSYFYFSNYDSLPEKEYVGNAVANNNLMEILPNKLNKEKVYEVSFWYKTLDRLDLDNILNIKEINGTNDTTTLNSKNIKSMINVQDKKVFATLLFKTDHPENKIIISLKGISDREKVFYLDDLMIRAKDNDVFKVSYSPVKKDSVLKINNIDTYMKTNR